LLGQSRDHVSLQTDRQADEKNLEQLLAELPQVGFDSVNVLSSLGAHGPLA
jgi:biopolymer transport protein ExbD